MSDNEVELVWDLMEKVGFCMLVTREGEDMRSRPMAAYLNRDERRIYFLTDVDSQKDVDIERDAHINLSFADIKGQTYVSVSATATISNDREKIKELWSTPAKAWWDSPDDPSLRIMKVTPKDAHYWNGPNTAVAYAKMAIAAVSDGKPDMGDEGTARL